MTKRAFIFDMDGTLIDSMPRYRELAIEVMTKHLSISRPRAHEIYGETMGLPFEEQLSSFGYFNKAANKEYHDRGKFISRESRVFDGVYDFIDQYDDPDTHFALISSSPVEAVASTVEAKFRNLLDWFSGIEAGSKLSQISNFLVFWNITPHRVMYFGDTAQDAKFAEQANVKFTLIEGEQTWKALTGIRF